MSEEQMKEPASRRVGALTSPVNIELHSRYAIMLWEGRRGTKSKSAEDRRAAKIMSMPEAIKMTGGLYRDSLADNPYADETMWKVENAIVEATDKINAEVRVLEGILRNIPSVITVLFLVLLSILGFSAALLWATAVYGFLSGMISLH